MKRLLLLLTLISAYGAALAQGPAGGGGSSLTGRITGLIVDSLTGKPVEYATVSIGRAGSAKSTNGSLSDEKGAFKVENVAAGSYRIKIDFLGYNAKTIDGIKTTPEKLDLNLGKIMLSPSQKMLSEVQITGQASVIENKIDRVVYNAERDVTAAGGNATDVLRKVPMLAVDMDGNLSLRGSQNVKVLINGKPSGSMANNMADALKMIPADQIKNVEVITSPSAKYDAEGTSGIINIITKKKNVEGVSGSISGGLGTRQNNGNANLNIKKGRLGITGNMGGNGSWPQTTEMEVNSVKPADGSPIFAQKSTSETSRLGYRGSVGMDYDFNSFNAVTSTLNFTRFRHKFEGDINSVRYLNNNPVDASSSTDREFSMRGIDWTSDFTHKFKTQGHELSFAAQFTENKNLQDYTSTFTDNTPNERANNDAKNQELTFQADYVQPFKKITWEAGAKAVLRDITSPALIDVLQNGTYVPDAGRSNIFDYSQNVLAGYTTLGFTLAKKVGVKLGGRYELTEISGKSTGAQVMPFNNDYNNFIPSITVSRSFKSGQTLKLSYNQRIQRPSLFFLNPFLNKSDRVTASQGNPYLSPEVSHNIELGYSAFVKTTTINTSLYYRRTNDVIESILKPTTDGYLQTFNNIGYNNSFGMNLFGSINPIQKLTLRGNLNVYTYDVTVNNNNVNLASSGGDVYLMYNAFINATLNLKGGFIAETFFIMNSPRRTFQGKNPSFNMWNMGFKKEILNKKGSIGLNIIDPLNARKNFRSSLNTSNSFQTSNFSIPFRSVGVNFSWNFGKMNFSQPRKKRVNNDDLKQGDQGSAN